MDKIKRQIRALDIPYPQRYFLELEVSHDVNGDSSDEPVFSENDLRELSEVHSTNFHRLLKRVDSRQRKLIETSIAFVPMISVLILITKEEFVTHFIREGGVSMYAILAIGFFLLGREVLNIFRLALIKDHSQENLRLDTSSVLLGCLALTFVGVGSTFIGLYSSVDYWVTHSPVSYDVLVIGAKESLANAILSSLICALIALTHYGMRRLLHIWRAPLVE